MLATTSSATVTSNSTSTTNKKSTRKHKFFRRVPSRKDASNNDSASTATSSTLDDMSATGHNSDPGVVVMVRRLSPDRQTLLLPPPSPQPPQSLQPPHQSIIFTSAESKLLLDRLRQQDQHALKTETPSERTERFLGPIDLDTLSDDDNDGNDRSACTSPVNLNSVAMIPSATIPGEQLSRENSDRSTAYSAIIASLLASANVVNEPVAKALPQNSEELDEYLKQVAEGSSFGSGQLSASSAEPGPIDVDDFIPEDSYWSHDDDEFILDEDEDEIYRGLAGYQEGCEPGVITDLSLVTWNEEEDDDEEDELLLDIAGKYINSSLQNSSAATANSKSEASRKQREQARQQQKNYPRTRLPPTHLKKNARSLPRSAALV
jgi:hypothetical protein